jgi:hypothetical protein
MIEKGTFGVFKCAHCATYAAKPGSRVILTEDFDPDNDDFVYVEWLEDTTQNDGGYFFTDFEFEVGVKLIENEYQAIKIRGVNKTVEVIAPATTLGDYIIIGQLLQTLPATFEGNLFTRPFLQDSCYCKYGWDVEETNEAIDLCVDAGLIKLV